MKKVSDAARQQLQATSQIRFVSRFRTRNTCPNEPDPTRLRMTKSLTVNLGRSCGAKRRVSARRATPHRLQLTCIASNSKRNLTSPLLAPSNALVNLCKVRAAHEPRRSRPAKTPGPERTHGSQTSSPKPSSPTSALKGGSNTVAPRKPCAGNPPCGASLSYTQMSSVREGATTSKVASWFPDTRG